MKFNPKELLLKDSPEIVTNPFSGEFCLLSPEAVAVYDYIKGCEYLGVNYQDALIYFRNKWQKEYMILLD